ncbi:WbuC family cupin fold metalloprotein [Aliikangiella sp. IMCC44632]
MPEILIDNRIKKELYRQAGLNSRKRFHKLLHSSHEEKVQRLVIALLQGSYIPPHSHEINCQWEEFVVLEGEIKLLTFSNDGKVISSSILCSGQIAKVQPKEIHTLLSLSKKALLLEVKEGPFNSTAAKTLANWSVEEESAKSNEVVRFLEDCQIGDFFMHGLA